MNTNNPWELVPLGEKSPLLQPDAQGAESWPARYVTLTGALMIAAAAWTSTSIYMSHHRFTFTMDQTPVAAVDCQPRDSAG